MWVEHLFANIPGGWIGFLIVVNILVFFLAFFLDFFEIAFIIVPLLAPVAEKILAPVLLEAMGGNLQAAGNAASSVVWRHALRQYANLLHAPRHLALPCFICVGSLPKKSRAVTSTGVLYRGLACNSSWLV